MKSYLVISIIITKIDCHKIVDDIIKSEIGAELAQSTAK